jgi:hypothetical protein
VPPTHAALIDKRPAPPVIPHMTGSVSGPVSAGSRVGHDFNRMPVYPISPAGYLIDDEAPEPEADRGGGVMLGQLGPERVAVGSVPHGDDPPSRVAIGRDPLIESI